MRSSWAEPYLWVHLAGIAAVPILLELCLVGLAASQTVLPAGLVFLLVALVGISPILWMQWYRPFSIFSLVVLALQPSELTEPQRQILQRFKMPIARAVAVVVAILAFLILWKLNQWLPFHAPLLKVPGGWLGGLLLAMIAFLLSNLFLQVPASVLTVLLTPERQLRDASPYPVAQIPTDFTLIGLQVKQILPPVAIAAAPTSTSASAEKTAAVVSATIPPAEMPQPEASQPEPTSLEAVQPEAPVLETLPPETLEAVEPAVISVERAEPQMTQPPSVATQTSDLDEVAASFEPAQVKSVISETQEIAAHQHQPPLGKDLAADQHWPDVTDTVVTIQLPVRKEATGSVASQTGKTAEPSKGEPAPPSLPTALPTVTDTIVTIGLPLTAAAVPASGE